MTKIAFKKLIFSSVQLCILIAFLAPVGKCVEARAQDAEKVQIRRQMENLITHMQPSAKQKVLQTVKLIENKVFASSSKVDIYAASVSAVKSQFKDISPSDIDALVAVVMFELWNSEEKDLEEMMGEMHKMNQLKEKQRDYINTLKKQKVIMKENLKEKTVAPRLVQTKVVVPKISQIVAKTQRLNIKFIKTPILPTFKDPSKMTITELEKEILTAEENLNELGDMSQLDQLALQDTLQKEQQFIQTISNIMKQQNDTLKSIIENMR
jgi:hypothetical protein